MIVLGYHVEKEDKREDQEADLENKWLIKPPDEVPACLSTQNRGMICHQYQHFNSSRHFTYTFF